MTKTYKSYSQTFGIVVYLNGEGMHVDFNRATITPYGHRGSRFTTDDKELQKAIESHKWFNAKGTPSFWTDDVEPVVEETAVVEEVTEKKPRGRKSTKK